jgi:hypothetical protein
METLQELKLRYELVYELMYMLELEMEREWGYDLTEKKERLRLLKKEMVELIGLYEDLQKVRIVRKT